MTIQKRESDWDRRIRRIREALYEGGIPGVVTMVVKYRRWVAAGKPVIVPTPPQGPPSAEAWHEWHSTIRPPAPPVGDIKISLVCPAYNTPHELLDACVGSVIDQTYDNWELVIADDASPDSRVVDYIASRSSLDHRIKTIRLSENGGIARATNAAIDAVTGDYLIFLDHDDMIAPTALEWIATCAPEADVVYSDADHINEKGKRFGNVCKPAWSPRMLMSVNYVNHLTCVRTSLVRALEGIRTGFDGAQDQDFLLRLSERPLTVAHIPNVLYSWRAWEGSTAGSSSSKPEAEQAGLRAVQEAIDRRGLNADAGLGTGLPFNYRPHFRPGSDDGLTKIVIPTRDRPDLVNRVFQGVYDRTEGVDCHVVIVDNGSRDPAALELFKRLETRADTSVVRVDDAFNFSRLVNVGAETGPVSENLLLLNNDIEIPHRRWLLQLVGWLRDPGVVAAGPKLLLPDGRIQHAGVKILQDSIAGHFSIHQRDEPRLNDWHDHAHEVGALTAACLLVRTGAFHAVGGLDEDLAVDFQDVDFCLKLRHELRGILMYDPTFPLIHEESASRAKAGASTPYTFARMRFRWPYQLAFEDPYSSPHFGKENCLANIQAIRTTEPERLLRIQPRWTYSDIPTSAR